MSALRPNNVRPFLAAMLIFGFAALSGAQTTLGGLTFNNSQFGDTLVESDGGITSNTSFLSTNNVNPGNPGYLTGVNFNTGIANIPSGVAYTVGYNTPIVNVAGTDLAVVGALFSPSDFDLSVSTDGTTFTTPIRILGSTAVDTGESRSFYLYGGSGYNVHLYVHEVDLTALGIAPGAGIVASRISNSDGADLLRVAGTNTTVVPEPASLLVLSAGALALRRRRPVR